MFAALPERRFCVPAPESHRSVASLRRRKLCLFRFRASTKAHPARCSSSPQKVSRLFGDPCYREVISRSDGHSVFKDHRRVNTLHLLWTKGCRILALFRKLFEKSPHLLRTNTCRNTPVLSKKVFSFFCRIGYPSPYTKTPPRF